MWRRSSRPSAHCCSKVCPYNLRSRRADFYLARLAELDASAQIEPATVRGLYQGERLGERPAVVQRVERRNATPVEGLPGSLKVADGVLGEQGAASPWFPTRTTASPRPPWRSRPAGRLGLAQAVDEAIARGDKRPIIAIVDVPSQAYGRREEALGIHQALAAAADSYARARLAGHPVIALLVGKAMSGAFLAHGYQANRLIALRDPGVMVMPWAKPRPPG